MTNEIVKQDTQEVQKPIAWFITTIGMVTTSKAERNKWVEQGHTVIELGDMSALRKENEQLREDVKTLLSATERLLNAESDEYLTVQGVRTETRAVIARLKGGAA